MKNNQTLAMLPIGKKGLVKQINTTGNKRRRFLDLGIIPGTMIEALYPSPWGDPIAFYIRGSVIALRKDDASHIAIETITQEG